MKIIKVKATNEGWLINGEFECGHDYSNESYSEELREWFEAGNKAEPLFSKLEKAKNKKLAEIKESKTLHKKQGVKVGDYTYFSDSLDIQKYKHAMNVGKTIAESKGIEWRNFTGTIKVIEGLVEVNGAEFEEAINRIDLFLYRTWYKNEMITGAVNSAETIEEVESISW